VSAKNNGIIPGYEPLSIGYHGDNGNIYQNLSKNVCLEGLIQKAQADSEELLNNPDPSLFDISNQMVYGGAYGPAYRSGDSVGVGLQQNQKGDTLVYFTINGIKLPALKLSPKSSSYNFYPVVSMKGKLCHFEVVKQIKQFSHNVIMYQED
jgi:hypothetical protein